MEILRNFPSGHPLRGALVGRLVRQVCNRLDGEQDLHEILRVCIGAALAHDLTPEERYWLIAGVEGQLNIGLEPMSGGRAAPR